MARQSNRQRKQPGVRRSWSMPCPVEAEPQPLELPLLLPPQRTSFEQAAASQPQSGSCVIVIDLA